MLSVGRLEANKGFDVLADALARASRPGRALSASAWRWVLVGTGPFGREIEAAVQANGLADRVLFAGRASDADLQAWYGTATLFVHPTRYEGSSLVTLEAMARRRAVVASRAGGLPDKVRPGENGWLVEPGDAAALASALEDASPIARASRPWARRAARSSSGSSRGRCSSTSRSRCTEQLLQRRPMAQSPNNPIAR